MKIFKRILSPKLLFAILIVLEILLIVGAYVFLELFLDVLIEGEVENAKNVADAIRLSILLGARFALGLAK